MRTVQMIPITEDNSLFITGFNDGELSFRVSRNPEHLQKEQITMKDGMVFTNLYHFPVGYLDKFINENR